MRQQVATEADPEDDERSTMAAEVEIVIRIKPEQVKNFLKQTTDLLTVPAQNKDHPIFTTQTKKRPGKDHSIPDKKPRLKETIKVKDNPAWKCENCTCSDLNVHVKSACKHEKQIWQCRHCGKSISNKANLQRHVKTIHKKSHEAGKWQCEKCGGRYSNKGNLRRHERKAHPVESPKEVATMSERTVIMEEKQNFSNHKRNSRSVETPKEVSAVPEKTGVMNENLTKTLKVSVTKYKCRCGKTEYTYDASVRHAQIHLVEALIRENGTQCEPEFDNRHEEGDNNRSLIKMKFDYRKLLTDSWFDMFKPTELSSSICSSSLYKHTRSVKLNWDSEKRDDGEGQCVPLYKCGACDLFVEPTKVQIHCENYYKSNVCVDLEPQGHRCPECQKSFYTSIALKLHKEDHDAHKNLRFRIVTFNDEGDVQFNKALEKMSLVSVEDTQTKEQQEISINPETTVLEINANVQHTSQDNVANPVSQYCAQCRRYYSDSNKHNAYHENERKRIMDEFLREEQQSNSGDTAEIAANKCNNGNAGEEVVEGENVSRNDNARRDSDITGGNVQAHKEYIAEASKYDDTTRMVIDSESAVMEWVDSDSDSDDGNPQTFEISSSRAQLNLKANYIGIIATKENLVQKTYNNNKNITLNSKLQCIRKNKDGAKGGRISEDDKLNQCELTLANIFGEGNNTLDTLEDDNESQSTEDLQRLLEDDTESVHSDK